MNASTMEGNPGPAAGISRPQSPTVGGRPVSGIVGRFLERTRSTRSIRRKHSTEDLRRRLFRKSTGSAAELRRQLPNTSTTEPGPTSSTNNNSPAAARHHQRSRSSATTPVHATTSAGNMTAYAHAHAQPQQTPTGGISEASEHHQPQQQQPQLVIKKKSSFRDRLKSWQKPPPTLELVAEEEPKPRFVYQPTHAAADFESQMMSPLFSPRQHQQQRGRTPPHHSPLEANSPSSASASLTPPDTCQSQNQSHLCNPFADNAQEAISPRQPHPAAEETDPNTTSLSPRTKPHDDEPPVSPTTSQPLSDYDLFIARAEAEELQDRIRRERLLRGSFASSSQTSSHGGARVRPDPHRQFFSIAEDGIVSQERRESAAQAFAMRNRDRAGSSAQYHHGETDGSVGGVGVAAGGRSRQNSLAAAATTTTTTGGGRRSRQGSLAGAAGAAGAPNWAAPNWGPTATHGHGHSGGSASPQDGSSTSDSFSQKPWLSNSGGTTTTTITSGRRGSAFAHGPLETSWSSQQHHHHHHYHRNGITTPPVEPSPPGSPRQVVRRKSSLGQKIAEYIRPPMPPTRGIETVAE
ncbi:hypothetical protein VTJ49DRAFT_5542 [Mycothermus thermophilus]|uniref:Uncharacterized protein n=1 Tax=Humicola insolens TaxID=85995 RepID=A0ABR3V422_HUMIN